MNNLRFKAFTYLNPYLDPPKEATPDQVADYYFFLVAIDHRTSSESGHFEEILNGKFFHGADLLYALGIQRWKENPEYFSSQKMQRISDEEVKSWLTIEYQGKRKVIYKPEERAQLLRDAGKVMKNLGYSSSIELVYQSEGYLIRENKKGLLQLLKNFKAYSDPISKKAFLWIKFLVGRGLLHIQDPENLNVPVDNHLMRIALRTGIIDLQDKDVVKRLQVQESFKLEEDLHLRDIVKGAFQEVLGYKNIGVGEFDDLLWVLGRTHCIHSSNPLCQNYEHDPNCQLMVDLAVDCTQKCPLAEGCRGFRETAFRLLLEPNIRTFFY